MVEPFQTEQQSTHTFNMELISKKLVQERLMARFVTGFGVLVELTKIACVK